MDIVLVTFNSSKWIDQCFAALKRANESEKDLNIYIVDNNSSDETIALLEKWKNQNAFHEFKINRQQNNNGFGVANNIGAGMGADDIICFINIDTEVDVNTFHCLKRRILN
ncbi:MAG: glycosyltransferase, partial [Lachnospiraceae bacterium]|nr:glycosyltransferase [Lachnospiraceae bacterium]